MLMAVYDSAEYCGNDCQTSLGLVGATQQGFGKRGKENWSNFAYPREFFTISPQHKNKTIANFVLAVPFKVKNTNKVCNFPTLCPVKMSNV